MAPASCVRGHKGGPATGRIGAGRAWLLHAWSSSPASDEDVTAPSWEGQRRGRLRARLEWGDRQAPSSRTVGLGRTEFTRRQQRGVVLGRRCFAVCHPRWPPLLASNSSVVAHGSRAAGRAPGHVDFRIAGWIQRCRVGGDGDAASPGEKRHVHDHREAVAWNGPTDRLQEA